MLEIGVEVLGGLVWWGVGGGDFSQNDGQQEDIARQRLLCDVVACKKEVILIYKTVLPLRI